jgi:hypothetical protein
MNFRGGRGGPPWMAMVDNRQTMLPEVCSGSISGAARFLSLELRTSAIQTGQQFDSRGTWKRPRSQRSEPVRYCLQCRGPIRLLSVEMLGLGFGRGFSTRPSTLRSSTPPAERASSEAWADWLRLGRQHQQTRIHARFPRFETVGYRRSPPQSACATNSAHP